MSIHFVRQYYPLGIGHGVLQAKFFVDDEPFVVMLSDDLIQDEVPLAKQLINTYNRTHASNIAVMEVPQEETSKYGIIHIYSELEPRLYNVSRFEENPKAKEAHSNLAIIGRYLLTSEIFEILESQAPGEGGEIQLIDVIDTLNQTQRVFEKRFEEIRYDVDDKFSFMTTSINYGLNHPEGKDKLKGFIIALGKELSGETRKELVFSDKV